MKYDWHDYDRQITIRNTNSTQQHQPEDVFAGGGSSSVMMPVRTATGLGGGELPVFSLSSSFFCYCCIISAHNSSKHSLTPTPCSADTSKYLTPKDCAAAVASTLETVLSLWFKSDLFPTSINSHEGAYFLSV